MKLRERRRTTPSYVSQSNPNAIITWDFWGADAEGEKRGSVHFDGNDGEQQTISVSVKCDNLVELAETFYVKLVGVDGPAGVDINWEDSLWGKATIKNDERNQKTGNVTPIEVMQDFAALRFPDLRLPDAKQVDGLDYPRQAALSPDGRHVYVSSYGDKAVTVFARDKSHDPLRLCDVQSPENSRRRIRS